MLIKFLFQRLMNVEISFGVDGFDAVEPTEGVAVEAGGLECFELRGSLFVADEAFAIFYSRREVGGSGC